MAEVQWQKVKDIFNAAMRQKPEERRQFINQACGADKRLLTEVESLVSSLGKAESFMETPAVGEIAGSFDDNKTLKEGICFGHYEIIRRIGIGGMGEVYLANDKKLDRKVAVKILNEKFSRHESNLERFIREAKSASSLNHPNILVIHEIGEADEAHYIVSEYIEGITLRDIFKEKRLELKEIVDISIQIANALSVAHEARLIHRDIKPENIMIRPDGLVKILDFGLAKLVIPTIFGFEEPTVRQHDTAKGVIMGTVNYMSPEQAKGEKVDARTDIFSLGVMIYEMIAGKTPFAGDLMSETFANLINRKPPPLSHYTENVPDELQKIVFKTLAKNKDARYQTMKDLFADLKDLRENLTFEEKLERNITLMKNENVLTDKSVFVTKIPNAHITSIVESVTTKIKHHKPLTLTVLVTLILVLVGISFAWYKSLPMSFEVQKITRLTAFGKAVSAAISSDGKYVAYVLEEGEQQSLWLRHIASESTVQIVPPDQYKFSRLKFSPDNNHIYFNFKNLLYQIPVLGGTPSKVLDVSVAGVTFSPDEKQLAFFRYLPETKEFTIIIADADGANERQLISSKLPIVPDLAWSPDGKVIACPRVNNLELYSQEVWVVQVADGTATSIPTPVWQAIQKVAWMPDGKSLLVLAVNQVWQLSYPSGEVRHLTDESSNYTDICLTSDGRSLAAVKHEQVAHLWTMPADDSSQLKQITFGSDKYDGSFGISWMPDGRIVYDSAPNGKPAAWIVETDGNNSKQLSIDAFSTAVSPDGRYLVFQNTTKEKGGIWRMEISDSSKKQLTRKPDLWENFSPDGKWLIYQGWTDQTPPFSLYKVSVDGGEPVQLTHDAINPSSPAVSPDGKQIAFSFVKKEQDKVRQGIALMPFDGGEITKMFDVNLQNFIIYGKQNLQWTPDGHAINYIVFANGISNIWRQPVDGSAPVQVTNLTNDRIFNFAYSSDSSQLALSRGTFNSDVVLIENFK
jgi:eukaryotic-like serine/threonine-protein kinase